MTDHVELDSKGLEAARGICRSNISYSESEDIVRAYLTASGLQAKLEEMRRERDEARKLAYANAEDAAEQSELVSNFRAERDALTRELASQAAKYKEDCAIMDESILTLMRDNAMLESGIRSAKWICDNINEFGACSDSEGYSYAEKNIRYVLSNQSTASLKVHEMRLCEASQVFLKPDTFYRFTVDEDCEQCKNAALQTQPAEGQGERGEDVAFAFISRADFERWSSGLTSMNTVLIGAPTSLSGNAHIALYTTPSAPAVKAEGK